MQGREKVQREKRKQREKQRMPYQAFFVGLDKKTTSEPFPFRSDVVFFGEADD